MSDETGRRHGPAKAQVRGTQSILNPRICYDRQRLLATCWNSGGGHWLACEYFVE